MIKGKRFLVTGGTGTIGGAVVRRLLKEGALEVVVFSRDEDKQYNMRNEINDPRLKFVIGDVRDLYAVDNAICSYKPQYVFHASAMKHVPFCEDFILEGLKTNVIGTNNVLDCCIKHKVSKVVFLSTDKASEPICTMGMTKAIAERLVYEKVKYANDTVMCITRFGNINKSRGSVVNLFEKQSRDGVPLTVTDPDMTRYMMSIKDAVDLVLFAFENGEQCDLFVYDAYACNIKDVAEYYSKDIVIIGNRGNEKVHEVLLTKEEAEHSLKIGKYIKHNRDLPARKAEKMESKDKVISYEKMVNML